MRKQISTWLAILLPSLLTAKIVINEVQSSNDETCLDEYGVSSDWIELYNTGSTAVDLSGWGISDNAEKPFKWSFPEGTELNANGHLRLFASGRETVKEEETALAEPTDFAPNLVLWLRGDDFSGRNQGARISRWTDRSGWGNNATQMLSRAPTVSLNAINGHTALSFNRSSRQHLLLPKDFKGMSSLSNVTIMVACKWGGTANSGLFGQWASGSSSQNAHFEIQSNGTLRWRVADSDLKVNTAVTPDVWMTLGAITDCDRETPTLSLIKDGLLLQSQVEAIGKQSFSSADLIYIGDSCNASNDSSGRFWDGLIAEVVIINRALTEQEWKGLAAYFAQKYDGSVRVNHHLPFRLGSEGETLTLSQPDGSVADQLTFGSLPCDTSYGRSPSGGEAFAWFATPTPEAANTETAYDAPLEPVSFSVERGLYETPLSLTLSHPDPAATIVYTLDYSEPSPSNGVRYAGETLTIAHTASVRAWASKPGALPYRSIQTHSYIFLSDVPTQTDVPAGCPTVWTSGGSTAATYGISTQVVATPDDVIALTNALRQLPILSLAIPMENVFGADHGVYSHATDDTLEEATSAEWITNGVGFVQIDAGLKAQGAASREFGKTPKKPLRLCFRGRYGFNRLKTPVLQDVGYPCDDFNTLVLRAEYNNAWTHSDSTQRARGSNIRDQWIRDTQQCMSGYQSHGDHVHLFINGRYWGIYNVAERVDASLAANLFGGEKEEYDGLAYEASNGVKARDGDTANWTLLRSLAQADLTVQANYEAVAAMIDLPAFADYMMLNFFGGNQDWPGNNFAMVCSRLPGGQFYFVGWDMERTLENVSDNRLSASFANGPKGIHDRLKTAPEYTLLFADRVHKHLFNGGALTAESTVPRYRAFTEKLRPAIFAEAARWGGYRLENNTASKRYGLSDWESEQNRILNTYLPQRPARFLSQLQSDGLYPSLAAPEFTETVNGAESRITLTVPSGATVYYTLDGSDPRTAFSGAVSATALRYTQALTVTATTRITARAYLNGTWSALSEYTALADRERAVFIQPDEGNWDKDDNWSTGTYPDGADTWAVIPVPTGLDEDGKRNVRINKKPVTIGHIEIYNGSATNRICNKKDAAEGSTLTFDGGDEPATLTVADSGGGMTVVDVNYGVILANDLRLIVSNATGHAEYGALRLQQGWSGAGGLIKEGPGLCSLTGEGKTYTGDTLIREGVITLTAKSIPTATRSISVEPGGQLRLVGGNASYPFPCPITISGFGRDMALGDGMNRQGALRYTPTSAKNTPARVETPVVITHGAAIHVSNAENTLLLAQGINGSGGLTKTGAGLLTLTGPIDLAVCATTVEAGTLAFTEPAEVASFSGGGTVACLAGRVAAHAASASLRLAVRLNQSGLANVAGNGFIDLTDATDLPAVIDIYLGNADDPADLFYGALCVPLTYSLGARLNAVETHVYIPDRAGAHTFDGETWSATDAAVSAQPVAYTVNGVQRQGRMIVVTRDMSRALPNGYPQWRQTVFSPEACTADDPATRPETANDGIPNLFRYAFGMTLADPAALFYPQLDLIGETRCYRWRIIPSRDDLRYRIEASTQVDDWTDAECLFDSDCDLPEPPDPQGWMSLTDERLLPQRFYRLRVILKQSETEMETP